MMQRDSYGRFKLTEQFKALVNTEGYVAAAESPSLQLEFNKSRTHAILEGKREKVPRRGAAVYAP